LEAFVEIYFDHHQLRFSKTQLGTTMSALTPEAARAFVDKLRVRNGVISAAVRQTTHPEALEALDNVRDQLGALMQK